MESQEKTNLLKVFEGIHGSYESIFGLEFLVALAGIDSFLGLGRKERGVECQELLFLKLGVFYEEICFVSVFLFVDFIIYAGQY
jgi:hypothetical protein